MIFVDTSAWFANVVPSDADHRAASMWVSQNTWITVEVVDENVCIEQISAIYSIHFLILAGTEADRREEIESQKD